MLNFQVIEQLLFDSFDLFNSFLYNSLTSLELFTVKVLKLRQTNSIINSKWFFIESLDWLSYSMIGYQLLLKNLIDSFVSNTLLFSNAITSSNLFNNVQFNPVLFTEHLELIYFDLTFNFDLFYNYNSPIKSAILTSVKSVAFGTLLGVVLKVLSYTTFLAVFLFLFIVTAAISSKSDWSDDVEFNISTISTEAEKELFSLDDAIYLFAIMLIFIAAYFGSISIGILFKQYDVSLFLVSTPLLFLFLIGVPFNLLYDFGAFFLLYLRGVSTTKVLLFELAYDYIGVIAFFTRLLVQFVRLVLMFVVYFMMHEAVVVYQLGSGFSVFSGSKYHDIFNLPITAKNLTYYLTTTLPGQIIYLMYETIHTMFVVTAQLAAFATIAFWLFLLFYSFFVFEKHENHFKNIRALKK